MYIYGINPKKNYKNLTTLKVCQRKFTCYTSDCWRNRNPIRKDSSLFSSDVFSLMQQTCREAAVGGVQVLVDAMAGIRSTNDVCIYFTHFLTVTSAGTKMEKSLFPGLNRGK